MFYRGVGSFITTCLIILGNWTVIECILHYSTNKTVLCDADNHQTIYEAFLLTEGEGITLTCGVCDTCDQDKQECHSDAKIDKNTKYKDRVVISSQSTIQDLMYDVQYMKLRLRERMWPDGEGIPLDIKQLTTSNISNTYIPNLSINTSRPHESSELNVYITLTRSDNQPVLLTQKGPFYRSSRVYLYRDSIHIKITRVEDTGVYTCFRGKSVYRKWSVTVVHGSDEPYRYAIAPSVYHPLVWQHILDSVPQLPDVDSDDFIEGISQDVQQNSTASPEWVQQDNSSVLPTLLEPVGLVQHNLLLYTHWGPWSQCVPCTQKQELPHSSDPAGDGFQSRVGICFIRLLDPFPAVKPHALAAQVDHLLRQYNESGLPCRSHLIREDLRKYADPLVINRPSEIVLRGCVAVCPHNDTVDEENEENEEKKAPKAEVKQYFSFPKRVQLRVREGQSVAISCPIRGEVRGPVTWLYSPLEADDLSNLTLTANSEETIEEFGSPSLYLASQLEQVNLTSLSRDTRGRYRVSPAYSLLVAELVAQPLLSPLEAGLLHLICVHGDARAGRAAGFSDWVGIVDVEVVPRSFSVALTSRITQVTLLVIPFILAVGTFMVVAAAIYTERTPRMVAAAMGRANKA